MRYVQPYGEADVEAPYINGDPSIGRMGSIPPAAAFEHPMRELVNVIENNLLTPTDGDLAQVAKGIRSQRSNFVQDTGSVNALSVALDPPLASYSIGLPLRVKVLNSNTGPSSINAGAGTVSIKKPNGATVAANDLPAGGLIELVFDGTDFQMINFGGAGGGLGDVYEVNVPYTVDTGTVNAINAVFSPGIDLIIPGTMIIVKTINTNTGPTTITVNGLNGLGAKPIYALGGDPNYPLLPGDLIAGDVLILIYDGTRWWTTPNTIINQNTTFTVGNSAAITNLFVALGRKRILSNVTVTIQLLVGIYGQFQTYHPNADRIIVQGTMLAANPTFGDFDKTGSDITTRAANAANNIAMLRTRYGSEIRFDNTMRGAAVHHHGPGMITFKNLLIVGPNVPGGNVAAVNTAMAQTRGSSMQSIGCSIWGSGTAGFSAVAGTHDCYSCFACNCANAGFAANLGASMLIVDCGSFGNAGYGVHALNNSSIVFFYNTGIPGQADNVGSQILFNGTYGAVAQNFGFVGLTHSTVTGSAALDLLCTDMSEIVAQTGSVVGSSSPAFNTEGNTNSVVKVVA